MINAALQSEAAEMISTGPLSNDNSRSIPDWIQGQST